MLWPIDTKGSPFRGLAAFGAKHAPVFFGRSRDITKAVDALKDAGTRETPFLLIVGASGSGKSSLSLAGLVPRLTAPGVVPAVDLWRVAVMRPGEYEGGPVAALAARLFDTAADNADECALAALAGDGLERLRDAGGARQAALPRRRKLPQADRQGARPHCRRSEPGERLRPAGQGRSSDRHRSAR